MLWYVMQQNIVYPVLQQLGVQLLYVDCIFFSTFTECYCLCIIIIIIIVTIPLSAILYAVKFDNEYQECPRIKWYSWTFYNNMQTFTK